MAQSKRRSFRDKVAGNAKQQKSRASSFGYLELPKGVSLFKEEPGSRVRLDILPYIVTDERHPDRDDELETAIPGSEWYRRPFKVHGNIGVNRTMIVCPSSIGKKCPVCQHRAKMLSEGASWQDEAVRALRPRDKNLYAVVPLGQPKYEEVIHIWDISQFLFQDKLNDELEEDDAHSIFPDPEEGLTLRIRFSEETFGKNVFAETSRIDFEERDQPYTQKTLNQVPHLDDLLIIKDYDTIDRMFKEVESQDEDPPRKKAEEEEVEEERPRRRRRLADDDDDDNNEGGGGSGSGGGSKDREEDERPRRRPVDDDEDKQPRRRIVDDADEDNDEPPRRRRTVVDDDEEEEQERPRRRAETPWEEPKKEAPAPKEEIRLHRVNGAAHSHGSECPHGYKFGADCDEHKECDKCAAWDSCMERWEQIHGKSAAA